MAMTWRSLDLLSRNLGGVGEGVSAFLKNRQEEEERQMNYKALQQYASTPEGQKAIGSDPGLTALAFQGAGYRAFPAIQAATQHRRSTAPHVQVVGGEKTGYTPLRVDPFTSEITKGDQVIPPAPGAFGGGIDSQFEANAALARARVDAAHKERLTKEPNAPAPTNAEYLEELNRINQEQYGARLGASSQTRTAEDIASEKRKAEAERQKATKEAVGLGSTINETEEQDILYRLSLTPNTDPKGNVIPGWTDRFGQHEPNPKDPQGLPDPTKPPYKSTAERKAALQRLEELQKARERKETEMRINQEKARQPIGMNDGWRDDLIPGYHARMVG